KDNLKTFGHEIIRGKLLAKGTGCHFIGHHNIIPLSSESKHYVHDIKAYRGVYTATSRCVKIGSDHRPAQTRKRYEKYSHHRHGLIGHRRQPRRIADLWPGADPHHRLQELQPSPVRKSTHALYRMFLYRPH